MTDVPHLRIGDRFDVQATGTVLISRSEPIDFEFSGGPNQPPMILRIEFVKDPETQPGHYSDKTRADLSSASRAEETSPASGS